MNREDDRFFAAAEACEDSLEALRHGICFAMHRRDHVSAWLEAESVEHV
jgi:hypothetical protein